MRTRGWYESASTLKGRGWRGGAKPAGFAGIWNGVWVTARPLPRGVALSTSLPSSRLSFLVYSWSITPTLPLRVVVSKMPCTESGKEVGAQRILIMSLPKGVIKCKITELKVKGPLSCLWDLLGQKSSGKMVNWTGWEVTAQHAKPGGLRTLSRNCRPVNEGPRRTLVRLCSPTRSLPEPRLLPLPPRTQARQKSEQEEAVLPLTFRATSRKRGLSWGVALLTGFQCFLSGGYFIQGEQKKTGLKYKQECVWVWDSASVLNPAKWSQLSSAWCLRPYHI